MVEKVYETIRHAYINRAWGMSRLVHGGVRTRGVVLETSERKTLLSLRHRSHMWFSMETAHELGFVPKNYKNLTDEQLNKHLETIKNTRVILKADLKKVEALEAAEKPQPPKPKAAKPPQAAQPAAPGKGEKAA